MPYAHAVIDASDGTRYERGDEVDLSKFAEEELDDLRDGGAIRDEDYDPEQDRVGPPATIVIEGVEYVQADDGSRTQESTDE
jgi:hypothetical protein